MHSQMSGFIVWKLCFFSDSAPLDRLPAFPKECCVGLVTHGVLGGREEDGRVFFPVVSNFLRTSHPYYTVETFKHMPVGIFHKNSHLAACLTLCTRARTTGFFSRRGCAGCHMPCCTHIPSPPPMALCVRAHCPSPWQC